MGNEQINMLDDVKNTTDTDLHILFSDGGSRGNPGPSACGFVIMKESGDIIEEGGEYLGVLTNNIAEYQGIKMALEKAIELGIKNVQFKADSLLAINQIKGIFKVKNKELWPIYERVQELKMNFDKITFEHIPREQNSRADMLVNRFLDEHMLQ